MRLWQHQSQRLVAMLERSLAPTAAVAPSGSDAGASCGSASTCCSVQERSSPVAPAAPVTASRNVPGVICGSSSTSCSVWSNAGAFCCSKNTNCSVQDQCRSVLWLGQQLLQRGQEFQERYKSVQSSSTMEQVPGSFWGRICEWEQVQDRCGVGFATLNKYKDRSSRGFVTWNKSMIAPGQDL